MFNDLFDRARRDAQTARCIREMAIMAANVGETEAALAGADRESSIRAALRTEAQKFVDVCDTIVDDVMHHFQTEFDNCQI